MTVVSRDADGTTAATFDTSAAVGTDVLAAELDDFRAGGLVVTGSFPSAEAGTHSVAVTYSLRDRGAFKAANYTLLTATATLTGEITAVEIQPACTPASGGDYDRDDDGLVEICDLAQLNAIRFDRNGDANQERGTIGEYTTAFTLGGSASEVQLAQSFAGWRTSYSVEVPLVVRGLRVLPTVTPPRTATINGKPANVNANTYVSLQRGKTNNIEIVVTQGANSATYTVAVTVEGGNSTPTVASAIADVSGLAPDDTRQVSLSGVFSDADEDTLTVTAESSDTAVATVSVASDGASLTVIAVKAGTATVTVTAQDGNGVRVTDRFTVTVGAPETEGDPEDALEEEDVVARYDFNKDGIIQRAEYQAAVDDIGNGVTYQDLVRIRTAWAAGGYQ